MSDIAVVVTEADDGPVNPAGSFRLLYRVRRWGYLLLGLQLAGFLTWSAILYSRFSVTSDFAAYYQPLFLIAHGNLDPYSTIMGLPFWQNDSEFMLWVLAPLYWITRSGLTLSWLQDISIAVAEAVVFTWMCELARRTRGERDAALLAGVGLLLLVANPWIWWAVSFDVHQEVLASGFTAMLAWDLYRGRRRAWFWAVPVLAFCTATATYVVGIGLGGVLAGRRSRRLGAGMVLLGIGYQLFVMLIHGDMLVSIPNMYGYLAVAGGTAMAPRTLSGLLAGVAAHPLSVPSALWAKRADILANLAPGGLVGLGAPMLLPLIIVVLLTNTLTGGFQFAEPIHQSIPIYLLLPVGTVAVLCWLARRHRRAALALAGLLAAQALGWAAVWGPMTAGQWLRVPTAAASTLTSVESRIPASAEVIASQGVSGRFAARTYAYRLDSGAIPVHGTTWFVIAANEGIETATPSAVMAFIGELAGPLNATLVAHANGVWAFRWTPPPGVREIALPAGSAPLPAWTAAGAAGLTMMSGPVSGWRVTATGAKGYVANGMEWLEPPGSYRATVMLAAAGPVNVEVWDDTTGTLVARQTIPATDGIQQVTLPVDAPDAPNATAFSGWGPFHALFVPPPAGQVLEVRVWSPGGVAVNVYSAELTSAATGPAQP